MTDPPGGPRAFAPVPAAPCRAVAPRARASRRCPTGGPRSRREAPRASPNSVCRRTGAGEGRGECMVWRVSATELERRQRRIRDELGRRELAGLCLFSPTHIYYLTGFAFIQTERPIGLAFPRSGRSVLFLPRLEEEHAHEHARVDEIEAYAEYPGRVHPLRRFA